MDDGLLEQIAAQQRAEQMLMAMLQNTLRNPAVTKRAQTSLVGIFTPDSSNGGKPLRELHVALPNGERWEIPVSDQAARELIRGLGGIVASDG